MKWASALLGLFVEGNEKKNDNSNKKI